MATLPATELLRPRAQLLTVQLQAEIISALTELGERVGMAAQASIRKAEVPGRRDLESTIQRIMQHVDVQGWIDERLLPVLRNAAGRTLLDTQRILEGLLGDLHLPESLAAELARSAGSYLDRQALERQLSQSIALGLRDAMRQGSNPVATARRIAAAVPAGRFIHRGGGYRAQVIARNETANYQREAALGFYEASGRVRAVRLRDGIYGPPRSDPACIGRDGRLVPLGDARLVQPYHVLCTLGFDPVI